MRAAVLFLLSGLMAAPLAAQDNAARTFTMPQGCTAYVTIQKRSCTVSHLFTCEGDAEGWQRRVDLDADSTVTYLGLIDAEAQWLESVSPLSGIRDVLGPEAADPASLSLLLETGVDTFDFTTVEEATGVVTRYRGQDRLTGENITLNGVTLEGTEYVVEALAADGSTMFRVSGREFVQRDWRSFVSGLRRTETPTESWDSDSSPVAIIFPGQPGFLSSTPRHDCGVMISAGPTADVVPAAYQRN